MNSLKLNLSNRHVIDLVYTDFYTESGDHPE